MKLFKTSNHSYERGWHISQVSVSRPGLGIRIEVRSKLSKRLRRQLILALLRSSKTVLADLSGIDISHSDAGIWSQTATLGRPVSLHQALGATTMAQAEGMNVRFRRLAFRLTQAEFAKLAGISRPHLSRLEHGRSAIEALTREKIAHGFRVARAKYRKLQSARAENSFEKAGAGPGPRLRARASNPESFQDLIDRLNS